MGWTFHTGFRGKHHTKKHRQEMSKKMSGRKRPPFSKEWIENQRKSRMGYKHSKDTKQKIGQSNKEYFKKHPDRAKSLSEKLKEAWKRNPNRKINIEGLKKGWELAKFRKDPRNEKICVICGKPFSRRGKKKFTAKCCSRNCCNIYKTGIPSPKKGIFHKIKKICLCGKGFKIFPSEMKKGVKYCSLKCRDKFNRGKNHHLYRGGGQSERNAVYHSKKYKNWRTKVFVRDGFTCMECGLVGGKLEAHHKKPFALYPKLRFIVKNGITLCKPCHQKTESWLRYYGKKTQAVQ